MLRKFVSFATTAGIIAVVAGVGWLAFAEFNKSETAHADASFSMVTHQTAQMGESLDAARDFISLEVSVEIGRLTDLGTLIGEWTPKYRQAQTAYRRFDSAIVTAEDNAAAYFVAQRALTDQFHSGELRSRARAEDETEFRQYEQWRDRARGVRSAALEIVQRFDDMDTTFQKLELRSDFSFDVAQFSEVPSDILELEAELDQFRIASDSLRKVIASPFDPSG